MALTVTMSQFHAAVAAKLGEDMPTLPLYPYVIDAVNEVPCAVLGFPETELDQVTQGGVLRLEQQVFVIANRQLITDSQTDLIDLAGQVTEVFGGGRATKYQGINMVISSARPRTLSIAGDAYNTYAVMVETESVNC